MKQWYEEIFENSAENYDKEVYTQGTIGEVDFIEKEIAYDKSRKILDIACGTGRHAIELAKRGYNVTGIDYSQAQLKRAKEKAEKANVNVVFLHADARMLSFNKEFDLALMLCEGAFPLMETDEMNFQILRNAANALKEKGKLILTTLNALFPLFHSVKEFMNTHGMNTAGHSFDLMTFRDHSTIEFTDDAGITNKLTTNERYYTPAELTWLLKSVQFKEVGVFGCKIGEFSRNDRLRTDDFEMLVVAEK